MIGPFDELAKEILPEDVEVFFIADEILLKLTIGQGGLSPIIFRQVVGHVISAQQAGADVVLVTCSSISPCVDVARLMVDIRVLKADEPMADKAVSLGARIGLAATSPSTLNPTTELLYARAKAVGKDVKVDSVLCEGGFDALYSGDIETHDRIVRQTLKKLMSRNDVVLLAQGSMARVADTIPVDKQTVPILSSPRLAVERVRDEIEAMGN
jgi:Asp/Glu/hydantoin racemase